MKRLALLMTCCGVALADEKAIEKLPPELRNCASIERNIERLACFDHGVAAILKGGDAPVPSAESSFGLVASATPASVPRAGQDDQVKALRGKVTALSAAGGEAVVTLDNGQVWKQISGGQMLLKIGDEVTINRAALGSFQMIVPTGRNGKVKRLR